MSKTKQPEEPQCPESIEMRGIPSRARAGYSLRLSAVERRLLDAAAARRPEYLSDYIRRTLLEAARGETSLGENVSETSPLDRIANAMERAVTLLEEIHAAIQPQEEADEVLDPDAGLVMLQATTPDGVARSYVVRTGSTKAAWEAACSAWGCSWRELREKKGEMEE